MNSIKFVAGFVLAVASSASTAAGWQSLGRLNGLISMPNTQSCEHRVINHYWSNKPIYYPSTVNVYNSSEVTFVFNVDIASLRQLLADDKKFNSKVAEYNSLPATIAKSLYGSVSVGKYPGVAINLSYVDDRGSHGSGWSRMNNELVPYEVQELCHF